MIIKGYANKATTDFMKAREVRYLCKVGREDLVQFGRLLNTARDSGLVMGKVVTASSKFYSRILAADAGDVVVELVGILASNKDAFLRAVQVPSMSTVVAVMAAAQEIEVTTLKWSMLGRICNRDVGVQDAFKSCGKATFRSRNCTLCLVKPHIIHSQRTGELLNVIASDGRFQISAIFSIHMTLAMAEELFEVYRGLFVNYTAMVEHMCRTPVLAVMITSTGPNAAYDDIVSSFREFVGPAEPALAKILRPESIR